MLDPRVRGDDTITEHHPRLAHYIPSQSWGIQTYRGSPPAGRAGIALARKGTGSINRTPTDLYRP